jgi:hypothetical protein
VVRCPAADTARRAPLCGLVHLLGSAVRLPRLAAGPPAPAADLPQNAAGRPAPAAGPPQNAAGPPAPADGPPASAAGPPQNADGPPASAAGPPQSVAYLPWSALRLPTIAPSRAACPHRVRRPVRGPGPAARYVSPGGYRRRPTYRRLAPVPPRPGFGTSRVSPAPSRGSLCGAGLRQHSPRAPCRCPVPHREEPASPGRGRQAHRTTAGCRSQRSAGSCGHWRQSGSPSGCARRPGRRWPCPLAGSRVLQPPKPTSSICHNTVPYSIISRPRQAKRAAPPHRERPSSSMSGGDLLSHAVPRAVPSALKGLTSGFGMGPGVSPSL